jgi:hypothetical protein
VLSIVIVAGGECIETSRKAVNRRVEVEVIVVGKDYVKISIQV